mmetsp:Transcript_13099/g.18049  ORF Transcript_13099/g.18049 Transcript_13099/m.18049 type:complete len:112 (+) Transcript_13099:500-835(+)
MHVNILIFYIVANCIACYEHLHPESGDKNEENIRLKQITRSVIVGNHLPAHIINAVSRVAITSFHICYFYTYIKYSLLHLSHPSVSYICYSDCCFKSSMLPSSFLSLIIYQ